MSIPKRAAQCNMEVEEYLHKLLNDCVFFAEEIWADRRLDKLAPLGWAERDILDWIATGPSRRGVLAPRGIGKTTFGTATYTCWRLFRNPDDKIIVVSKSHQAAKKMVKLVRGWIDTVPFLKHLRPQRGARGTRVWRDNTDMFDVGPSKDGKDPSVLALGIGGQLENARANVVIGDDVETKGNTKTLEAREDLDQRVREFASVLYPGGEIVYFGTYHHEESLYIKLSERGYVFRTWPLLYPQPKDKILNLAPKLRERMDDGRSTAGDIVFDHRHDRTYIEERQAEGRSYFAMQQMLIADLGDSLRYPLTLRDLIVFNAAPDKAPISIAWGTNGGQGQSTRIPDIPSLGFGTDSLHAPIMFDGEWAPYTSTKMWIDPSGRGADKTGYGIVGHLAGMLYAKAVGGLSGGYDTPTLDALALLARDHHVNDVYVEDNFGQGMFATLFEPVLKRHFLEPGHDPRYPNGWHCSIQTIRVSGQKEIRIIDALEPVVNQHRLVVDRSVVADEDFQRQYTRITRQPGCLTHEDELESLAMAVCMWQDLLHVDPVKAKEREDERRIDDELRKFREQAGIHEPAPAWFHHH